MEGVFAVSQISNMCVSQGNLKNVCKQNKLRSLFSLFESILIYNCSADLAMSVDCRPRLSEIL